MSKDVDAALAGVEEAQAALRKKLKRVSLARLRERPPSGAWSPMEHVRHLVFAEQHHFSPFLKGFRWSSAGVPAPNRTGERRLNSVGGADGAGVDAVFDAWAAVHGVVRGLAIPDAIKVYALEGNLRHVQHHVAEIERLLKSG